MADVDGRLINERDIDDVVGLMHSIGVHFAGSKSTPVLRAVARDAVRRPRFVAVYVVEQEHRLAGLVIAFSRRAQYWRMFPLWHPLEAARMAAHRLARKLQWGRAKRSNESIHARAAPSPDAETMWQDDNDDISKVMYVGVDPAFRGAGLGHGLYRAFFRHLAAAGYRYCDAQVSTGNTAAIALHRSFPFEFFVVPGGYFARLNLAQPLP